MALPVPIESQPDPPPVPTERRQTLALIRCLNSAEARDRYYEVLVAEALRARYFHCGKDRWWRGRHDSHSCLACQKIRLLDRSLKERGPRIG